MELYGKIKDTVQRDELLGGTEVPVRHVNVSLASAAQRGEIICSDTPTGAFAPVSSAADASKVLLICENSADKGEVTQAYSSGLFNRKKIVLDDSLNLETFEEALRHDNILFN